MTDSPYQRHPMSPPARDRDGARHKAADFFKAKETRSAALFQQMQTERVISDAKTAKLRALRFAKEDADREAARHRGKSRPGSGEEEKKANRHPREITGSARRRSKKWNSFRRTNPSCRHEVAVAAER